STLFSLYCYSHLRDLHSFPTRRSSDLMSLEKRFVDRDRFHSDAFRSAFIETDDPVDHQKRITMRKDLHDLVAVESAIAFRHHSRSEEHTSELQSPYDLVCRLLLEKKNN